jgi:hypothetical protein
MNEQTTRVCLGIGAQERGCPHDDPNATQTCFDKQEIRLGIESSESNQNEFENLSETYAGSYLRRDHHTINTRALASCTAV